MTRTERDYYVVLSLYHFSWSFLGPLYALFLLSRGLDLLEISIVLAAYMITSFVFEVPTGAVADVFGRKVSFIASCAVRSVAFLGYAFADGFREFLIFEVIDAIGATLATGALDAWAVDGVRREGDRRPADRLFARGQMLSRTLMIVSGLVAGYVAEYGIGLVWFVGSAMFFVTGTVGAVLMTSDRPETDLGLFESLRARPSVLATLRDGWQDVRTNPVLLALCGLTAATAFAYMPATHYWQPRLQNLSGQTFSALGWMWAAFNLAAVAGAAAVPYLERFGRAPVLAATALLRAVLLAVAAVVTTFVPAFAGVLVFELGFSLSEPVFMAWVNEQATAERRATVLSWRQMAFTLGAAIGLAAIGTLARETTISTAWLASALVLASTCPLFVWLGRRV